MVASGLFDFSSTQFFRMVYLLGTSWGWNICSLYFAKVFQIFTIVRASPVRRPLQIAPQMLHWSQVWAVAGPLQSLNLLFLVKWSFCWLACMLPVVGVAEGWNSSSSAAITHKLEKSAGIWECSLFPLLWPMLRFQLEKNHPRAWCYHHLASLCRWSSLCQCVLNIPVKTCQPGSEENTLFPRIFAKFSWTWMFKAHCLFEEYGSLWPWLLLFPSFCVCLFVFVLLSYWPEHPWRDCYTSMDPSCVNKG